MLYLVRFEDNESKAEMRGRFMGEHKQFLKKRALHIKSAGPASNAFTGLPEGGIWMVEAPDEGTVLTLVKEDPLFETGLRKSVSILEWHQVFKAEDEELLPA